MMKKLILGLVIVFAVPFLVHAETWQGVPIMDTQCSAKVKDNPDSHTTACALACAKSGYGIIASDGSFLKFDQSGNDKVLSLLKGTKKKDHLRVTVNGERNGEMIKVNSVTLND